jgi:type IV pilus assembly protein PilZ
MDYPEKRQHRRIPMVTRVTHVSSEVTQYYYSTDISMGGMFLKTRKPFKVGTELELDFELAERSVRIKLKGSVVRTVEPDPERPDREPGMGISFTYIEPESKSELTAFLADM